MSALTLKPEPNGSFVLQDERGDPVAVGIAHASRTVPGYVTVVVAHGAARGLVLRVPSDWGTALRRSPSPARCACTSASSSA